MSIFVPRREKLGKPFFRIKCDFLICRYFFIFRIIVNGGPTKSRVAFQRPEKEYLHHYRFSLHKILLHATGGGTKNSPLRGPFKGIDKDDKDCSLIASMDRFPKILGLDEGI